MAEPRRADPFPSTRWSRVIGAGDPANPERQRDFDELARDYWVPIKRWLAGHLRVAEDEAADLAQDFFVRAIEQGTVAKADRARGRFRAFLKAALKNFAIDRARRDGALKRGGGRADVDVDDGALALADERATPDAALDAAWREVLLARALASLEHELGAAGKEAYFRVFADYFLGASDDVDYATLAARHELTTTTVSNWLMHGKRRFRELLHEAVAETVSSQDELADELAWLFAGVKGGAAR